MFHFWSFSLRGGLDGDEIKKLSKSEVENENTKRYRFAAKEAAFKAHPTYHLSFHDIVIRSVGAESGPVAAIIRGTEVDFTALVSISHDGGFAVGVCLGCAPGETGGPGGKE